MFKAIQGYEGLYEINDKGEVFSLNFAVNGRKTGKKGILKATKDKRGYLRVSLCKNKVRDVRMIHRLLAQTFVPNPLNKPEVNHMDGNSENNAISNLEWVTHRENCIHAVKNGLRKYK